MTVSISNEEVKKIAHLARLAIAEDDLEGYAHNLSNILGLVAQMDAIDTTKIEPMAHPLDVPQRLRKDEVSEKNQRDSFLAGSPSHEAGLFLVPKVIE